MANNIADNLSGKLEEKVEETIAATLPENLEENVEESSRETLSENDSETLEEIEKTPRDSPAETFPEDLQKNTEESRNEILLKGLEELVYKFTGGNVTETIRGVLKEDLQKSLNKILSKNLVETANKQSGENLDESHLEDLEENVDENSEENLSETFSESHEQPDDGCFLPENLDKYSEEELTVTGAPLEEFFALYSRFKYDKEKSAMAQFENLKEFLGWKNGSHEENEGWDLFQDALYRELNMVYGDGNDLASWQVLCRILLVDPIPETIKDCRKILRTRHVNLVDLVNYIKNPTKSPITIFESVDALRRYTRINKKYFSRKEAQQDGIIKFLLRQIFIRKAKTTE